ncbi:MAG: cytochrome ubiquinol oxidase subunit I [Verrucomicrobia bacterium]|nr:cytochrome ubiquinol oxidase subunit I [Verrucomicrobiota bacterium]MBV8273668.1 cytochrome ubiquinol oxidase subunit I [Verrucomicrobiota bacterium]
MDTLMLGRWQFGITTVYHFLFVPLSIGLAFLVAVMQTIYYRTENEIYDQMTRFFGRLFVILFTLGVVTGIVQEFQFGMNWSEYSRFVGDIFGIPLAIEALAAFFLESTFLGLWLFGRDRLPKWVHLLSIWCVATGTLISAYWILVANAWMQVPVGYHLANGRAELTDFVAVFLNERVLAQYQHVVTGSLITGGFFVLGISAWHLMKGTNAVLFSRAVRIALIVTTVSAIAAATTGHSQAQYTARTQPMKLAAMEGLWNTEQPASFSLFAVQDEANRTGSRELNLPYLLSVLGYNNLSAKVEGMKDLQAEYEKTYGEGDYIPPVTVVYWSFRIMVGLGMLFILVSLIGFILWWRGTLDFARVFHRILIVMMFLPFVANTAGWLVTEIGRQPWVVFGLLKTANGVSTSVDSISVWVSMLVFTLLYGVLAVLGGILIYRFARPKPDGELVPLEETGHAY